MSEVTKVTAGKPKIGGAIFRAPAGTALPTDTTTALNEAFIQLGYVSEEGLVNSNSAETTEVKAWGGDVVLNPQTGKADTFKFKLLEALDANVLKAVYNSDNVTEANGMITVTANSAEAEEASWVVEMIMRGNKLKRIVIPTAKMTELEDISYTDNDPVGYGITLQAYPDTNGNTHYEYIK